MKVKELKRGDYFTVKPIEYPRDTQVWVRGEYDRELKAYSCYNFADVCRERFIKGDKDVFVDFIF